MKKLFFLLLVVNLVIWLWAQREQVGRVSETAQTSLGGIRLLDDAAVAARRELAARQANGPEPVVDATADSTIVFGELATEREVGSTPGPGVVARTGEQAVPSAHAAETNLPPLETVPSQAAAAGSAIRPVWAVAAPSGPIPPSYGTEQTATPRALPAGTPAPASPLAGPATARRPAPQPAAIPAPLPGGQTQPEGVTETHPVAAAEPSQGVPEVLYLCESVGPFREQAAAARFQEGMSAPLRAVTIREEHVRGTTRYWVLALEQPDRESLADYLSRLEQAGVRDRWRIPSGPYARRLSLGVFHSADNAREHAEMLAAKGVSAEIRGPKDEDRVYWIDYERAADADAPDMPAGRNEPARRIVSRTCGRAVRP